MKEKKKMVKKYYILLKKNVRRLKPEALFNKKHRRILIAIVEKLASKSHEVNEILNFT